MKFRALAAAIALVAIPIAVQGAEPRQTENRVTPKGCQALEATGSRLGSTTRCRAPRPARASQRREAPRAAAEQTPAQSPNGGGAEQSVNTAPQP